MLSRSSCAVCVGTPCIGSAENALRAFRLDAGCESEPLSMLSSSQLGEDSAEEIRFSEVDNLIPSPTQYSTHKVQPEALGLIDRDRRGH